MQFTKPTFIRDTGSIVVYKILCYLSLVYSMYSIVLSKVPVRVQSSRIHPVNLCNLFFLLYSFYDALKKTPIGRYYAKIDRRNFIPMIPKGVDGPRGGVCRVLWNFNGPKNR